MLSPLRLPVACLPVTLVHPTQAVEIFGNISMAFWYVDHPLTSKKKFMEIFPEEPFRRES